MLRADLQHPLLLPEQLPLIRFSALTMRNVEHHNGKSYLGNVGKYVPVGLVDMTGRYGFALG